MSKTSARFNLADISRATKAAKAEGAAAVDATPHVPEGDARSVERVAFRRVQTLVREASVGQAAQFCFVYWVISRMLPVGL
jgi:hypothetical protein